MEAALNLNTYTQEKTIRERVIKILKETGMKNVELASKIGLDRSTISQYLNNKYGSNPANIEASLIGFIEGYEKIECGKKGISFTPQVMLPEKVECFESRDYVRTIGVCRSCQEEKALGLVIAKPGYGKTHTLKKYAKMPRVIYIGGNENMNCKDIVRRIESQIGMFRSYGSVDERMQHIIEFFNINEGYLIIMDEADKLINKYTQKKIELLRDITDDADVGLVLAGELVLEPLLKRYDKRLAERMDFYNEHRGLSLQEVQRYLDRFDVDEAAMAEFLTRATNSKTGSFRLLDRTLNNVIRILKDSGQTKITMNVMKQASNMMML